MTSLSTLDAGGDVADPRPSSHLELEHETDAALVNLAVAGDSAAFDVLLQRYRANLLGFAVSTLGSPAEADDVVQEAFIAAWNKLSTLNDPSMVKPWLMRVVRNKCMDRLRAASTRLTELDDSVPAPARFSPFEVVSTDLQNDALDVALSALPTNQRRVWEMRELSGLSYAAMAEELDMTLPRVRGLLARARQNLANQMESWR